MGKRWWGSGILFFCAAAALVWCWRDTLLDTVLAARAHLVLSSLLLLLLYMLKGLTAAVPLSALEAVGGMLFPLPGALALNTAGVALAQAGPYWMGRLRQTDLAALTARFPGSRRFCVPVPGRGAPRLLAAAGRRLSRRAGQSGPGRRRHLLAGLPAAPGLLGSLPRVAASTVLGSALPTGDTGRMGLSLACGAVLTALSLLLWQHWRTH
ncbi:MAG: hypothetical protein V8R40_12520 [Dysosmobacter sp.]